MTHSTTQIKTLTNVDDLNKYILKFLNFESVLSMRTINKSYRLIISISGRYIAYSEIKLLASSLINKCIISSPTDRIIINNMCKQLFDYAILDHIYYNNIFLYVCTCNCLELIICLDAYGYNFENIIHTLKLSGMTPKNKIYIWYETSRHNVDNILLDVLDSASRKNYLLRKYGQVPILNFGLELPTDVVEYRLNNIELFKY